MTNQKFCTAKLLTIVKVLKTAMGKLTNTCNHTTHTHLSKWLSKSYIYVHIYIGTIDSLKLSVMKLTKMKEI